ncbi:DUF4142 domain-containing protein [Pollutibacter soli]|uniref:DUF4142 domain-containing protein n=1 Tax=Pollutibacter soli TaxID=3034157 RepID=UPI0030134EEF
MKQMLSVITGSALLLGVLSSCGDGNGSDRDVDSTKFGTTQSDRTYTTNADSSVATLPAAAESKFVSNTVEANYAELSMAKLALQTSNNNDVKHIAKMLEEDHNVALNGLQQIAIAKSISVPASETDDARKEVNKLSEKKGSDFDKAWCKEMIDKHEKSIKNLEEMEKETTDPQVKTWISETLPKIRTHRDKLVECHDKMK